MDTTWKDRTVPATTMAEAERELELMTHELARSEARFRDVIERNADAIVVVDSEGRVRFANSVAATLFGSTRDALLGSPFGFPIMAGETTELDLLTSATPRVVEMRVVDSEWEGESAYIASLRDVTERKRAEEDARRLIREHAGRKAAERTARRFHFLADCGSALSSSLDYTSTLAALARLCVEEVADWIVIYLVDDHGGIKRLEVAHRDPMKAESAQKIREYPLSSDRANPVAEVLLTRKPILRTGVSADELGAISQNEDHAALLRDLGLSSFMLVPLIARDRAIGAIALVSADPNNEFTEEDLALAEDLSLRAAMAIDNARLYQQAQEANQTKSDFLALISHDLRTPLTSIIGYSELLKMGLPDPLTERCLQSVERIRTAASHLLYLMDELLAFARLDARQEEVRIQPADLAGVLREVSAVMEPLAVQRGLQLRLDLPENAITIRTDPDKLRQILMNLVANAVKYTHTGGVTVEVRNAKQSVFLCVSDTGPGIEATHLAHIFEPFWQVDRAQRNHGGGTGLGLSIVRRLVDLLGGEIRVDSTVGQGTAFTISLPCTIDVPETAL